MAGRIAIIEKEVAKMQLKINESQLLTIVDEIVMKQGTDNETIELLESTVEGSKDVIVRGWEKVWVISEKGEITNAA